MHSELERLCSTVLRKPRPRTATLSVRRTVRVKATTLLEREDFLRGLDAEIPRIKRSGRPLAVALMQIEAVHAAGEPEAAAVEEAALLCTSNPRELARLRHMSPRLPSTPPVMMPLPCACA